MSKDIRDAFFDEVYRLAVKDKDVIFISADADAFSLKRYKKELPDQFINVGVAEQNMALVATGLALTGKKVFIYSITPFIAMRCFEQIKVNICSMNLPIAIVGLGSGYSFSYDGPTHHATQDIAIMRTLPEITILNPCDENTSSEAARICYNNAGPTYVRIDKGVYQDIYSLPDCATGLKETSTNSKIKILTTGYTTHMALKIAEELQADIDVVDIYRLKPLNQKALIELIQESDFIFTLEENTLIGGLGSMICELVVDNKINTNVKRLGLEDKQELSFGSREWLMSNGGLGSQKIIDIIRECLNC